MLSASLNVREEIAIRFRLKKESLSLRRLAHKENPGLLRKVLIRASREALSNSSHAILRMFKQINTLVNDLKPKALIVTYEGHAWERIAFASARIISPEIKCIGYQHAALFRMQHAIRRNLAYNYNPDQILTAGEIGKVQLQASPGISEIPIKVLGSNRVFIAKDWNGFFHQNTLHSNQFLNSACLVLPEGITSECFLLFEFSLACAKLCPEIQFIWRLHPLITFNSLIAQNAKLKDLPTNIVLSQATFEEDISCSRWALYRGTTAIIKAIQAGLIPVYLEVSDEMTIDPLYELENWKIKVTTSQEFQNGIASKMDLIKNNFNKNEGYIKKYCESFFLPFNSQVVIDTLRNT